MFDAKLLINAQDVDATGLAVFERRSPISDQVVTIASAATVEDARHAANVAAAAFPAWSQMGPAYRRDVLVKAADKLVEMQPAFTEAMYDELGATREWAEFNVAIARDILIEAASMTTSVTGEVVPSSRPGSVSLAYRQPVGVCLGIAPWNAPVILGVRAIAMALACGNTVLLKGSELCPRTHRLIGEVMHGAGLPAGVLNVILNAPADAEKIVHALIEHPAVRRINFTGSTRVGRQIAEKAARHLKRCLLELGGKAPLIVLDDADIDEAVKAAAFGAFMNQGQICMSTERIILHEAIADAFIAKFVARARQIIAGDTRSQQFTLGPVINEFAAGRIRALITDAVSKGAEVLCGGAMQGNFLDATVLDKVTPAMRVYEEESFGPLVSLLRAGSDDEAVTIANASEYGLSSAIFSRDIARALSIARRVESGICHINGATVADEPQMPFGGVKASGYGRFGGVSALDEFTELRWISIESGPAAYPI
ncbi:MAG TPA: aldehyde dehydrogenase [Ensifer sp.]|nr:aldehyde dehydrogenase [Ensifer sp.]